MVHRKGPFREDIGQHRRADRLGQSNHLFRQPEAPDFNPDDDHRPLRLLEPGHRLPRRLDHLSFVGRNPGEPPIPIQNPLGNGDHHIDFVPMDLQITGPSFPQDRLDHFVDLFGGPVRIVDDLRRAGQLFIDVELRFDLFGLMMDENAELSFFLSRSAGDDQDRDLLGEGAGDRIDHVEPAGAVGDADDAELSGAPRVAVGGEADPGSWEKVITFNPRGFPNWRKSLMTRSPGMPKR